MRITYNADNKEALDALLQRDETLTILKKNLQKLMVEVYKRYLFTKKVVDYGFGIKMLCEFRPARSHRFVTNSLKSKDSLLWNSLSDEIKSAKSLAIFKQKITS